MGESPFPPRSQQTAVKLVSNVENKWETGKRHHQVTWSRQWDTILCELSA